MRIALFILLATLIFRLQGQNVIAKFEKSTPNAKKVKIEGAFVDVYVKRGDRNYLTGIIEGNGEEGDYEFNVVEGSICSVSVNSHNKGFGWSSNRITKARIDITLMTGVGLEISNSSGDINLRNIATPDVYITTSSGDVSLMNTISNLDLKTTSGDIDIQGLKGDSNIKSTSGDQNLRDVMGTITMVSTSGDIKIDKFDGDLDVRATSGDIDIRGGKGTLNVKTTSGEIEGEDVLLRGNTFFKATSGDIAFEFLNEVSELSFDLRASSGDLEVGNRSAEKKLVIDRGDFLVSGETSSGDQEYDY